MGTSKSHGGPTDTRQLLPAWAQTPEGGVDAGVTQVPAGDTSAGATQTPASPPGTVAPPQAGPDDDPDETTPAPGAVSPTAEPWRAAKGRLGRAALPGSGRTELRAAGGAYVRARGGGRVASASAKAGRQSTASLASFFSSVASGGVAETLAKEGLARFVGRDAKEIFAAITDLLAPPGATSEEAAARHATASVLEELFERFAVEDGGLQRLDAMSAEDVRLAVEASIANYIYCRWLGELGLRIETKAISYAQAERLERDMKEYVRDIVKVDLQSSDVLAVDWKGAAGARIIHDLYEQAYNVLGEPV